MNYEIVLKVSEEARNELIQKLIPSGTVYVTISNVSAEIDFDAEIFVPAKPRN